MGLISRVSSRTYRKNSLPDSANMSYEYIYILPLDQGKFYVGRNANPEMALFNHKYDKVDCEWTQTYKPAGEGGFLMAPYVGDEIDVETVTHQLMTQYGYDNVRNSTKYTSKDLNVEEIKELKEALGIAKEYDATVACTRCGRMYHCGPVCTVYRDILGEVIKEIPEPYQQPEIPVAKKQKLDEEDKASEHSKGTGGSTTSETDSEYTTDDAQSINDICIERGILQ